MKNLINWKLYFVILVATIASIFLSLPYVTTLMNGLTTSQLMQTVSINSLIAAVGIFIGLFLGKKIGFGLPVLEDKLNNKPIKRRLKHLFKAAPLLGLTMAAIIILISTVFSKFITLPGANDITNIPTAFQGFLASFYGGIFEEVLLRLFQMTVIAWVITFILSKVKKIRYSEAPRSAAILGIVISALLFGISHLGAAAAIMELTPALTFYFIVLNMIPGLLFGWLYWKKGLEYAIVSHFFADIGIHVLYRYFETMFLR